MVSGIQPITCRLGLMRMCSHAYLTMSSMYHCTPPTRCDGGSFSTSITKQRQTPHRSEGDVNPSCMRTCEYVRSKLRSLLYCNDLDQRRCSFIVRTHIPLLWIGFAVERDNSNVITEKRNA